MANEVAVVNNTNNAIALIVGNSMNQESFNALDNILDNIGKFSGDVDDATRQHGLDYINQWENIVINRIYDKRRTLDEIMKYFNVASVNDLVDCYGSRPDVLLKELYSIISNQTYLNVINNIADCNGDAANGYTSKFEEHINEAEGFFDWVNENRPIKEFIDKVNSTPAELTEAVLKHDLEKEKFGSKMNANAAKIIKRILSTVRKVNNEPNVKKFIKEIKKQAETIKNIESVAKEKASIAKMNMVIPNVDLRKCLRELSEFQKNL